VPTIRLPLTESPAGKPIAVNLSDAFADEFGLPSEK